MRVFVVLGLFLALAEGVPVKMEVGSVSSVLVYLTQFGYMPPSVTNPQSAGALISQDSISRGIKEFQAFAGLNQTGIMDEETMATINLPRCGVKDKVGYGSNARRKRYALQGSRWRVKDLTYRITKYPKALLRNDVDREIEAAFKVWEDVTDLSFSAVTSGRVHIEIRFERGEHGDGDPFDGPGGTLAHAYFPIYGGDAHFDDTESWTINSFRGTNLFQVAAHEFGHSLGLSHSDVRSSLMAPFYRGYERNFELDADDIQGIQALYGVKQARPTPPTQRPPTSGSDSGGSGGSGGGSGGSLCRDPSIDAIVTMSDKNTYAFKGSQYWMLTDDGIAAGYPKRISPNWGGLPANLDAAFTWTNGKTYFFKNSQYWRFSDLELDSGYPKQIKLGFAGVPNDIDAAFVWSGNGKIYFFKGKNYWRFDPSQRPPVMESYPKPVSNWEGLPDNIDDALQYSNGYTYFFKGGEYWRFNDRAFRVDSADPSFPRPAGYWWFGCSTSDSLISANHVNNRGESPSTNDDVDDDDTFDADGSDEPSDNQLHPRTSGSRSVGYQEKDDGNGASTVLHSSYLSLVFTLLLAFLLRL